VTNMQDIQALRGRRVMPIPVPRGRATAPPPPITGDKPVAVNELDWCAVCGRGVLITESEQLVVDDRTDESVPIHPACRPAS